MNMNIDKLGTKWGTINVLHDSRNVILQTNISDQGIISWTVCELKIQILCQFLDEK